MTQRFSFLLVLYMSAFGSRQLLRRVVSFFFGHVRFLIRNILQSYSRFRTASLSGGSNFRYVWGASNVSNRHRQYFGGGHPAFHEVNVEVDIFYGRVCR